MLVLSRRQNEQIVIEEGRIVLTVVRLGNGAVRIGIDAPVGVAIHRREVFDRIAAERIAAEPAA